MSLPEKYRKVEVYQYIGKESSTFLKSPLYGHITMVVENNGKHFSREFLYFFIAMGCFLSSRQPLSITPGKNLSMS